MGPSSLEGNVVGPDDGIMVTITDPRLHIDPVEGHPGERRVVVTYSIHVPPFDPALGETLREEAIVSALDEHDAPVAPTDLAIHLRGEVEGTPGATERRLTTEVRRADLDVEQDWWRINEGGGFDPIAEFVDHLVADVTLRLGDQVVATARTPPRTGSWGALGSD